MKSHPEQIYNPIELEEFISIDYSEKEAIDKEEKLIAIRNKKNPVVHKSLNKAEMLLKTREIVETLKMTNYLLENIENDNDAEFITSIRRYKENIKNSNKRKLGIEHY